METKSGVTPQDCTPATRTRVVNVGSAGARCDVYIGREQATRRHWGNPFRIGPYGTRADVVHKFDLWIHGVAYANVEPERRAWMLGNVGSLRGKILGCHCSPEACHGHILARLADGYEDSTDEAS